MQEASHRTWLASDEGRGRGGAGNQLQESFHSDGLDRGARVPRVMTVPHASLRRSVFTSWPSRLPREVRPRLTRGGQHQPYLVVRPAAPAVIRGDRVARVVRSVPEHVEVAVVIEGRPKRIR